MKTNSQIAEEIFNEAHQGASQSIPEALQWYIDEHGELEDEMAIILIIDNIGFDCVHCGWVCTADQLTQDDVRALHEMKTSEFVDVYLEKDGSDVIGVIITEGLSSLYDTEKGFYSFTVALEFPEDYKFFDIKNY